MSEKDASEYCAAKLQCRLSGDASRMCDYIAAQEEGFVFRNETTRQEIDLSVDRIMRAKRELERNNIIKISEVRNGGRKTGQNIDFNFDFDSWGNK